MKGFRYHLLITSNRYENNVSIALGNKVYVFDNNLETNLFATEKLNVKVYI